MVVHAKILLEGVDEFPELIYSVPVTKSPCLVCAFCLLLRSIFIDLELLSLSVR